MGACLSLRHISEADSKALHQLLRDLLQLATAVAASEGATPGEADAARRARAEQLAPSVGRLRQLSAVLVAAFGAIRAQHEQGDLNLLRPKELLGLLTALFDHAALRSKPEGREFVAQLEKA